MSTDYHDAGVIQHDLPLLSFSSAFSHRHISSAASAPERRHHRD
jgi:hypothetical protein